MPLAAAALQFSIRAPFIDSTVVGVSRPERVLETLEAAERAIPDDLWAKLVRLVPARETWLDA